MPSKVKLLSSRPRPTNRMFRWLPSLALMAPGARIPRLAQLRPFKGMLRTCCDWMTSPTSAELRLSAAAVSTTST